MCVSQNSKQIKDLPYELVRLPASESSPQVYILITNQFTMLEYKLITRTKYSLKNVTKTPLEK